MNLCRLNIADCYEVCSLCNSECFRRNRCTARTNQVNNDVCRHLEVSKTSSCSDFPALKDIDRSLRAYASPYRPDERSKEYLEIRYRLSQNHNAESTQGFPTRPWLSPLHAFVHSLL